MKIKPKKSLGQNFLSDQSVIRKIVEAANLQKEDVVLEIGPGKGILTEALASKCQKVIAVEIDQNLIPVLQNRFKNNSKIEIIHQDILQSDIKELENLNYKLIANLPYYITSPIIRKFLESETPPQEMILMVQKEVAERITASKGEMSILAVSVQYYATAEILFLVPRTAFDPAPEVDSAVIRITHNAQRLDPKERDNFFRVVRAGFCAKRKTLANNLANSFHLERTEIETKLAQIGIASNARSQELSVEDWKKLSALFQ
jgi:16S rRNA (adenine1518-N6/adenine1519-N6)-dimethyltransferase